MQLVPPVLVPEAFDWLEEWTSFKVEWRSVLIPVSTAQFAVKDGTILMLKSSADSLDSMVYYITLKLNIPLELIMDVYFLLQFSLISS